jgi:hypothetical protein
VTPEDFRKNDPGAKLFRLSMANREESKTTERPVESAAAEKIDAVAFGTFFLMIFTSCLESKKRFPHLPQGPATTNYLGT